MLFSLTTNTVRFHVCFHTMMGTKFEIARVAAGSLVRTAKNLQIKGDLPVVFPEGRALHVDSCDGMRLCPGENH